MAIPCAAYARFSSDNQRDESIDAQVRAIEDYARLNGYVIVKTYVDKARSATSDRRAGFQQMIKDSATGQFSAVIVHKLDRFSRDKYDSAVYKRRLKTNGVHIVSVLERLDGSPESLILESVIEAMAEYYSKNLARETMKGMRENAYQCRHTGGIPPLGYDVEPSTKKLVINEYEAETVRMIFDLYLKGFGYDRICDELNRLARTTKRDQPFGKNSLHDILINEKYAGIYVFNCSASKDFRGRRNNHARKADEDVIRIEGGVPAVVPREVFDAVQRKMQANRRSAGSYKSTETYLLSGRIWCGECRKPDGGHYAMAGNRHRCGRNQSMYVSYRCSNRDRTKLACDNTELRREYVEDYVISELRRRIFNEANIPSLTKRLNEHLAKSAKTGQAELKRVRAEHAKVTKQIDNIVSAVASGGTAFQSLMDKMADLEEAQATLQARIDELEAAKPDASVTEEHIRLLYQRFDAAVQSRNVPALKQFVAAYVQRVVVYRDRVEVTMALSVPEAEDRPFEIQTASTRKNLPTGSGIA